MEAKVTVRWAHKDGNTPADYEDVWCLSPPATVKKPVPQGPLRLVVGDGATESYLAGSWARLLAAALVKAPSAATRHSKPFAAAVVQATSCWSIELDSYIAEREASVRPIKWHEWPNIAKGAFATMLTLHIAWSVPKPRRVPKLPQPPERRPAGRWYAAAIGDTCMFQVRSNQLRRAFPIISANKFNDTPPLLGSSDTDTATIASSVCLATGTIYEGDHLYLCTDALAEWFLRQHEDSGRPWEVLNGLSDVGFHSWLQSARADRRLRNDDVTLMHVSFGDLA